MKLKLLVLGLLAGTMAHAQPVYNWAKSFGSTGDENVNKIATDAAGNVYVIGSFSGTVDFDPSPVAQTLDGGSEAIFIGKYDASGNLAWVKSINGTNGGYAITADAAGNVYASGRFSGTVDFDPGPLAYPLTSSTIYDDVFVSKLDVSGNFVWARAMGGPGFDVTESIAVDASGNVYTTGSYESNQGDFDPGPVEQLITGGRTFISKLDASGNYVWAASLGAETAYSIAVDASNNVYTTGYFSSATADFDPGPGTYNLPYTSNSDMFISKLDASGNFVWAKGMGGTGNDGGDALALDASNNIYIGGGFEDQFDFDPGTGVTTLRSEGADDIFISKFDDSGNLLWVKSMGNTHEGEITDLAVDGLGNVYTMGYFYGTVDFDPGSGTHELVSAGNTGDIVVSKFDPSGNYVWAYQLGNDTDDEVYWNIAVKGADDVLVTGTFYNTVDFDPGAGVNELTSEGDGDVVIAHVVPITLPLTLLQFQAVNNAKAVQLSWQTTQEENTASFSIERSANGKDFTTIGSVPAANTALKNNYAFPDDQPLTGTGFYRLKMIDRNGRFNYSATVTVRRNENGVALLLSPNPVKDVLYVQAKGSESATVQIADVNGRILQQQKVSLNGNTSFSISVQSLPAGSYYLIVKGKETKQVQQFLKQ
ncbi:hypothetical protein A4H97_09605 [Niastella yeongjuensis]|uniref:Secretion system C-terminal sorting domain-containing protein n=1 Tax=Niastella yeongjuensis TaxID=354355 RepID=A0A1V9EER7_9BACT|nr:T9SS type A sorting domain-containing protein [Niastella yeongjuensis]OQP44613.1 hypothetical protein A4H97_09605 [Niastella yeongjuensis]SEO81354.1 Por secretion system C-terminal sorting domain-containing protein [Niastella yeongjuensis]